MQEKWDKTADGAIAQIKKNQYPQMFQNYGADVILVGISYDVKNKKHTCKIERWDGGEIYGKLHGL